MIRTIISLFITATALCMSAQVTLPKLSLLPQQKISSLPSIYDYVPVDTAASEFDDQEFDEWGFPIEPPVTIYTQVPKGSFMPTMFASYIYRDSLPLERPDHGLLPDGRAAFGWLDDLDFSSRLLANAKREFELSNPQYVKYNLATLPEPPKNYRAFVDPVTTLIVLTEEPLKVTAGNASDIELDFNRVNWLHTFNSSVQFSQAYVSPNWYQGGNNNLNMLVNLLWNVKLNEAFHKNIMFETTVQYKLGLNSAPDDTLRNYSISEDLLQINSKFGYKAVKHWYYSIAVAFKTQMLNSYTSNTRTLRSAFLSPGDLNVGAGMTYDYSNPKKTFTFNASISPISWNMKTCINSRMDETAFGIRQGRNIVNQYGSSTECTMLWKMAWNITYRSRLFAFTDYDNFQSDWEHTLSFDINKFLSTQVYAHLRYDTQTKPVDDPHWHKFQIKEILSFGISYKFATR